MSLILDFIKNRKESFEMDNSNLFNNMPMRTTLKKIHYSDPKVDLKVNKEHCVLNREW